MTEIINDAEFLILYESYTLHNPEFPYNSYTRFDLEQMDECECLAEFRVKKQDIGILADVNKERRVMALKAYACC